MPDQGAVLGIDVGFSSARSTTCFCLLKWGSDDAELFFRSTTSDRQSREHALSSLCNGTPLAAVAIDGPLVRGLGQITHYRAAESVLSRGALQVRGKPGQTSSPTGLKLHEHATMLAEMTLARATIANATHHSPIHERRLVEAFPNTFLAALISETYLPNLNRDASDRYWEVVTQRIAEPNVVAGCTRLDSLFQYLLPNRQVADFAQYHDHEHRAGIICATTALCVAVGTHIAVGDDNDGDIMLPPRALWAPGADGALPWLEKVLRENVSATRRTRKHNQNHKLARVVDGNNIWIP